MKGRLASPYSDFHFEEQDGNGEREQLWQERIDQWRSSDLSQCASRALITVKKVDSVVASLLTPRERIHRKENLMKVCFALVFLVFGTMLALDGQAQQMPFDWSISEADSKYDEGTGESDAKAYLRLGDMVILAPGNPPIQWRADIRDKEYRRFGVEWRITGDVSMPEFEAYRKGFNRIMEIAVKKRFGADFFEKSERRIDDAIQKAAPKARKH
ncbi:hypothetical protein [Pseudoduganella violaceinigra]|uniref:hypothetical protein n=1 Tax=Pseudoduganella violaceinigra TaxID=246602 RepID=UPI0012B58E7C|nr:hypothetical protein [Pseudoduganella violaceinigra]